MGRFSGLWERSMDGSSIARFVEPLTGSLLIGLVVLDIFFTVLYARLGIGVLSHRLACWVWWLFSHLSKPFSRHRDMILSFAGPVNLMLLVSFWFLTFACG